MRLSVATIALAIVVLPTVSGADSSKLMTIEKFAFDPPTLAVSVGERVSFVNRDELPHSVVGLLGETEIFRSSEQMDQDETYSVVMDRPGEIVIRCGLHASMSARIVVKP
ncbi:MAG: plastocyanin/azurin family copper-binding protein [Methylocystis sp.]